MFDEDARRPAPAMSPDEAHFLARATDLEIDRNLAKATREGLRAFSLALAANARRDLDATEMRAALAALEPFFGPALAVALASADADKDLSTREASALMGRSKSQLARLVREKKSPVPFTMSGRFPRFKRADIDAFLGESPAAVQGPAALLAEAIRRNLPTAPGRALIRIAETAKRIGWKRPALWYQCTQGRPPVPALKFGSKFFFRLADVEAYAKANPPTPKRKAK